MRTYKAKACTLTHPLLTVACGSVEYNDEDLREFKKDHITGCLKKLN